MDLIQKLGGHLWTAKKKVWSSHISITNKLFAKISHYSKLWTKFKLKVHENCENITWKVFPFGAPAPSHRVSVRVIFVDISAEFFCNFKFLPFLGIHFQSNQDTVLVKFSRYDRRKLSLKIVQKDYLDDERISQNRTLTILYPSNF